MEQEQIYDSIQYAAQIGRLDFLTATLAVLSLVLLLAGVYAFFDFRRAAKKKAAQVAREVAEEQAEQVANLYLQNNISNIIASYEQMVRQHVDNMQADQIAKAYGDNGNDTGK